jgi:hypothetical protein
MAVYYRDFLQRRALVLTTLPQFFGQPNSQEQPVFYHRALFARMFCLHAKNHGF